MYMSIIVVLLSSSDAVEVNVRAEPPRVTEHHKTQLICNYTISLPEIVTQPICRWTKLKNGEECVLASKAGNYEIVAPEYSGKMSIDDGNLVLTNITREYAGTYTYEVQILNDNPFINSDEVKITVLYLDAPRIVLPKNVIEGDDVDILCYSSDAYPDPILTIYKDDQPIASMTGTTLNYTISNAMIDTGVYYCNAHNSAGSKNSDTDSLNVHYIRCQQESDLYRHIIVAEGKSVPIPCQVNANPSPNYTFYKNNKAIKNIGSEYTIGKATPEDDGNYYCVATNNAGNVTCGKKSLLVFSCFIKTFTLEQGSLTCIAEGNPEPNTTIIVNGNEVANGRRISTYKKTVYCNMSLIAKCVAENNYCTKSQQLQSCDVTDTSGNTLTEAGVSNVKLIIIIGVTGLVVSSSLCFYFLIIRQGRLPKCSQKSREIGNQLDSTPSQVQLLPGTGNQLDKIDKQDPVTETGKPHGNVCSQVPLHPGTGIELDKIDKQDPVTETGKPHCDFSSLLSVLTENGKPHCDFSSLLSVLKETEKPPDKIHGTHGNVCSQDPLLTETGKPPDEIHGTHGNVCSQDPLLI